MGQGMYPGMDQQQQPPQQQASTPQPGALGNRATPSGPQGPVPVPGGFRGRGGAGVQATRGGAGFARGRGRGYGERLHSAPHLATVLMEACLTGGPARVPSPLPPNVPTGPRNQNKYKDRDTNSAGGDVLDYGGGRDNSHDDDRNSRYITSLSSVDALGLTTFTENEGALRLTRGGARSVVKSCAYQLLVLTFDVLLYMAWETLSMYIGITGSLIET